MKVCSLKCLVKYSILISLTSFITTIVYHIFRRHNHTYSRSLENELQFESITNEPLLEKTDWHDRNFIEKELQREGNGEQGKPATLPPNYDKHKYDSLYNTNGYNAFLSDFISINRSLPDIRHKDCKKIKYRNNLPDVSIIIPLFNEHWSTLLRTVYSVINRSPSKLIKEIILVDDASTKAHCKIPLNKYISTHIPKGKVIHLKNRQGLIRARLAGAQNATGKVLVFLDSHTEANVNWLPPLLDPITENYRACVCPFIDVINYETFEYKAQDEGARGVFDWEFNYKRLPLFPEDLMFPTKIFKSPVMAGGLFAISSRFFWELGGYDPGLDIWGGEQYELSFKIWQCGGEMFDAPCSRIGHIYRKFAPFGNSGVGDFVGRNYKRVAEVWMDEYAEYFYKRKPHYRSLKVGDLSKQKEIRQKLHCKPFKWFMNEIAYDLIEKYPPIEPPNYGNGSIKPYAYDDLCLTVIKNNRSVTLASCSEGNLQNFLLSWHKDIQVIGTNDCLDISDSKLRANVKLYFCHHDQGNQLWRYDVDTKQLIFGHNLRCLDWNPKTLAIFVNECDSSSENQMWSVSYINQDAIAKWHETKPIV